MIIDIGLNWLELSYCAAALFGAGFVRGYSGFGSSALAMTSLALVLPPAQIVPVSMLLEVLATLILYREIRTDVAWRLLGWLTLGGFIATPVGLIFLQQLPADTVRLVMSAIILCACTLLWHGKSGGNWARGATPAVLSGVVSGLANGIAAMGGLPAVIFLIAAIPQAVRFRATSMVFLLLMSVYGFAAAYFTGLVDDQVLTRLGMFMVPSLLGVYAGHRRFNNANPESFRRFALALLVLLATAGIFKVLLS